MASERAIYRRFASFPVASSAPQELECARPGHSKVTKEKLLGLPHLSPTFVAVPGTGTLRSSCAPLDVTLLEFFGNQMLGFPCGLRAVFEGFGL
jgi:hypothetical protein